MSFLKLAIASGATATAGAGLAASTLVISESKDTPTTTYSKVSSHIEDEEILPQPEEALEQTEEEKEPEPIVKEEIVETPKVPETPQCFIYEVREPKRIDSKTRVIEEILKKIDQSKEDFLSSKDRKKSSTFIKEVGGACPSNLQTSKNVYVWQDSKGWQYSEDLQKKNWLAESGVTKPSNLEASSKR
ncbi:hypothetical protein HF1_10730 [Mycoplasma haemofelis str. Langford 1]|uniref:Uncharacterized protein n=1 Tax=Mycoplasma haemofelis (strain Langford 1) TaxID=941640 RepID=E8ZIW0_MYCHL|nr:hypothetical protein [Mycoplasma haemofelis]CBY93081.1 hypothetical protein HF1_10730 [Mycoplasma haemofelis str. Langford 1]